MICFFAIIDKFKGHSPLKLSIVELSIQLISFESQMLSAVVNFASSSKIIQLITTS